MRALNPAVRLGLTLVIVGLTGGCGPSFRVYLVNATTSPVLVKVDLAEVGQGPQADVAPGGRFKYSSSGSRDGRPRQVTVMPSEGVAWPQATMPLLPDQSFRGWVRAEAGGLVLVPARAGELPYW
jgi:hypothetical protein